MRPIQITKSKDSSRIFHHYQDLEEYRNGMWRKAKGDAKNQYIKKSFELMKNIYLFKDSMRQAIIKWVRSCEHNLTIIPSNRLAWLGHAGCCIYAGSPEECTRKAWHLLTDEERNNANRAALDVLAEWDKQHKREQMDFFND